MVWDEVEPLADVIIVNYNQQREDIVAEVILDRQSQLVFLYSSSL